MGSRVTPYTWPISSRVRGRPSVNPKTQPDYAGFALRQRREHPLQLIAQQGEAEHIHGAHGLSILGDIPSRKGPSSPTLWSSEKRPASGALQRLHLLQGDAQMGGELPGGLAAQALAQLGRRRSLLMTSTTCTGRLMARAWSTSARVMAWRIHQVA
jgi:hypothetical protein